MQSSPVIRALFVAAAVAALSSACSDIVAGAPVETHASTSAAATPAPGSFPDFSGYTEADADKYFISVPHYSGYKFGTPDGLSCTLDSYPMPEYASVSCSGPRPDEGPGDWEIRAERNEAATINQAPPPENPNYQEPSPPALPPLNVIRYLGDIVCGVDDNGMTACRVGEHGFVLTPTATTLF
jgi:hypothetical protein